MSNLHTIDSRWSPLAYAIAKSNNLSLVEYLLDCGADMYALNPVS